MADREGDIAKGIPVNPQRLTFDAAMAHVIDHYKLKQRKSTDAAKRRIEKHLKPFTGGRKMAAIATDLINRYASERLAEDNVRTGFFEREQFEAVRDNLATDSRPLVTFMYLTG